jgi:serine/threonine-protein kinase
MGAVYLGRNRELGSPVAVKVLPLAGGETESGLARFKREARLAANLSHPNIVPVFDFDIRQGMAYLVMPFVVGETLAQVLERQGGFSVPELQELLEQVGAALAFAHRQGVVHRDIKPANLMREDATNRWLVTDFGIARMARPDAGEQTETGVALGTPAYMAPEQWTGSRDVDGRADLYSLARVACEALIGKRSLPCSCRHSPMTATGGRHRSMCGSRAFDGDRARSDSHHWQYCQR